MSIQSWGDIYRFVIFAAVIFLGSAQLVIRISSANLLANQSDGVARIARQSAFVAGVFCIATAVNQVRGIQIHAPISYATHVQAIATICMGFLVWKYLQFVRQNITRPEDDR